MINSNERTDSIDRISHQSEKLGEYDKFTPTNTVPLTKAAQAADSAPSTEGRSDLEAAHLAELAKVRLEEAHNCKPVECRLPAHIPFRWPACSACQSMARWEERIAILEAAK